MADLGVFSRYKSFDDYQGEEEKNSLAAALAQAQIAKAQALEANALKGGNLPAPLQLANEFQKRIDAGDVNGANNLMLFAKTLDKGLIGNGVGGVQQIPNYAPAVAGIEGEKAGAKQQAEKNVDIVMNPQIKKKDAYSSEVGKQLGETASDLNAIEAAMPQLETAVNTLSDLGKKATYTTTGRGLNTITREAGLPMGEGAQARAAYIAHVKNNVLPLLRRTFGAQFTKAEGDSLLATLGDPNSSPEEKDATLNAFIADKKATLNTMSRQVRGINSPKGGPVNLYQKGEQEFNAKKGWSTTPSGINYRVLP